MFSATLSDVKILRDSIDTISQIIDEGVFQLKPEGIELTAADRAMVAVVDFRISPSAFDSYMCDSSKPIALNLINFLTILRRAGPEDKISLKLNDIDNRLEITLAGESVRKFAIPLLDIGSEEVPNINQFQFSSSAELSAEVFSNGIDDADVIADSVMIELSPSEVRMSSEGDSSRTELKLEKGSVALSTVNTDSMVRARYPLEYLKKMMKASKISSKMSLKLGNDYPMKVEFSGDKVKIGFVLAPRVSEE